MEETRDRYRYFLTVATRWKDNDVFGHINNVVYYSYIDTAVTDYYFAQADYDVTDSLVIPNAAETGCTFRRALRHPVRIEVGLRAEHIGNSSSRIGVGIFREGDRDASAFGYMVHVWVDRVSGQPVSIPATIRDALRQIEA